MRTPRFAINHERPPDRSGALSLSVVRRPGEAARRVVLDEVADDPDRLVLASGSSRACVAASVVTAAAPLNPGLALADPGPAASRARTASHHRHRSAHV